MVVLGQRSVHFTLPPSGSAKLCLPSAHKVQNVRLGKEQRWAVRAVADVAEASQVTESTLEPANVEAASAVEEVEAAATSAETASSPLPEVKPTKRQVTDRQQKFGAHRRRNASQGNASQGTEPEVRQAGRQDHVRSQWQGSPIPPDQVPFKEGDHVLGKVVSEDPVKGWRIQLVNYPEIFGIVPPINKPFTLRDSLENFRLPLKSRDLVRMFCVERIPEDMCYRGKGPVLSARLVDLPVIWRRAEQLQEIHSEKLDTLAVNIRQYNEAGLLGVWEGIPLFIPWKFALPYTSRITSEKKKEIADYHMAQPKSYVCICDVLKERCRFVGNLIDADQIRALEGVQIGDLMSGHVVKVSHYGVFARMGPKRDIKGLLHIRNISQARTANLELIFKEGDEVTAFLLDVDENNKVEFTTMELESYPGQMLEEPKSCYEAAPTLGTFEELHEKAIAAKADAQNSRRGRNQNDRYQNGNDRYQNGNNSSDGGPEIWRSRDDLDLVKTGSPLEW